MKMALGVSVWNLQLHINRNKNKKQNKKATLVVAHCAPLWRHIQVEKRQGKNPLELKKKTQNLANNSLQKQSLIFKTSRKISYPHKTTLS